MTIQEKVLEYLDTYSIKKKGFAKLIGVSPVMLSHWFAGRVCFDDRKLSLIMKIIEKK